MKEAIYTIPISEVFEPKDGCPLCRLRDILEQRCLEYIMGAAMMEPDIRVETNRLGFCKDHYFMMLKRKNRLSIALMLQSHLDGLLKDVESASGAKPAKRSLFSKPAEHKQGKFLHETCYVCDKIEEAVSGMVKNLCKMYQNEPEFKKLYQEQSGLCYPHYQRLMADGQKYLSSKEYPAFAKDTAELTRRYLQGLKEDVDHFCTMFDYRNAGPNADWGNSRDAIERSIHYLTSRNPIESDKK